MDPITETLVAYNKYLRDGGEPASLARFPHEPHKPERLLSASDILLCDRKACYNVLGDLKEIEPDIPEPNRLLLDFRIGNLFEGFIAEAMEWRGALVEYQTRLSGGKRKGRLDLLIDAERIGASGLWLVEVKTVKSKDPKLLEDKFPKGYNIGQAQQYADWHPKHPTPVLFYALRDTFHTKLFSWDWEGNDCVVVSWDPLFGWTYKTIIPNLWNDLQQSMEAQERWLKTGELPPRCGESPEEHPFLCVSKNGNWATPTCKWYGRCWNTTNLEPFKFKRR